MPRLLPGLAPLAFGQCLLTSLVLLFQLSQGEVQRSCAPATAERGGDSCQLACQCRAYPPLPPPPPPPPPPKLLIFTVAPSTVPPQRPWWSAVVVLGTVLSASAACLLLTSIVCYKAIKRKPLRREENGTRRVEDAMGPLSTVDARNTGV